MKYMGVDYGTRRVGIALSDSEGVMAFPHTVIENKKEADVIREILKLAKREHVGQVIVGIPAIPGKDETEQERVTRKFVEHLSGQSPVPVKCEDEYLTTKIAHNFSRVKIDASAASIILQSYIDKRKERSIKS